MHLNRDEDKKCRFAEESIKHFREGGFGRLNDGG